MSKLLVKRLGLSLLFETLENIPLFLGGVLAMWWGVRGQLGLAAIATVSGSALGSLAIHFGEGQQSPGFESTWRKTFFNFVAFVVCTVIAWLYFSLIPGGWWDFVAGFGLGLLLSVVESPSYGTWRSWWRHAGTMAVATGLGLVMTRQLLALPTLVDVVAATASLIVVLSVVITTIEYWPQWYQQRAKVK
jgi:hypothetical protein